MNKLTILNESCKNTLVEHLGMVFTGAGDDWLEVRMPVDRRTCRPDGALHGGANMALAETVSGALSFMVLPEEKRFNAYGIEINGNHVKRAEGKYVVARAEFVHQGRRTHVINVEIHDEFGTLVTVNRVTNMIVGE
ncbi:PaaI family thioesterase [Porphyromonadaceae bacterium OttesenSCG-928-L07]|nr:PaaI family thioesterase [Porphyromonadaceae bacterium OttesenSCG-928-L07]MDL2283018.1 PaaI family thioesterase [Odoribacter sp. OttesenSCG-928-G04]MDL2331058.1 PaaI family thioesterase [Odoribacter sp. OttesenSCG-928-A06]